ncbi:hypothetical protein ES332_D07G088300v1 [Gossypium tomentosum]|uniref:Non-specific lipid-transfer protein n=1 Tax=Gossypium tomentosum TaxID=34277 RepID=A0A5D2K4D3_GOSTO|nr:hypothetical protein ES332_D07G088300v1 [Gossypium tomentosum]
MEKKFMGFSWSLVRVLVFIMILVAKPKLVDAITCQETLVSLIPCQPFLIGGCSSAVANINAAATTPAIRRDLCRCFKKVRHGVGVVSDKAKQLPRLCDVKVAVSIDPTVNCGS